MCQRILFFFQAEDGIRDHCVTGVQTCALPISSAPQTWRGNSKSEAIETANHLRGGLGTSTGAGQPLPGFLPGRRSEERRVGKECRSQEWPEDERKKKTNGEGETPRHLAEQRRR